MKCPVCKNTQQKVALDVHENGFDENITQCDICGTVWSTSHGIVEIVQDAQEKSFLEATSESVEGDDYGLTSGS